MSLCLTCNEPINGRATGLENYLKSLSPTSSEFEFLADKVTSHQQVKDVEDEGDDEDDDEDALVLGYLDKMCAKSSK